VDVSGCEWLANAAPIGKPPKGHNAIVEVAWGARLFTHGKVTAAVQAFDTAMQWDGSVNSSLWQRGCAMYYTEQWEAAAAQFALDVAGNPNDTEESIWRWLCQARARGVSYAARHMLNTTGETRPYMVSIYAMFQQRTLATEQAVLALCGFVTGNEPPPQDGQACFYSDMYYGLYSEAHGNTTAAQQHLRRAGLSKYGVQSGDYMWWLTRVHCAVRNWSISSACTDESCCNMILNRNTCDSTEGCEFIWSAHANQCHYLR